MKNSFKYGILKNRFIIVCIMFLVKDLQLSIINIFGEEGSATKYNGKAVVFSTVGIFTILIVLLILVADKFFDLTRGVNRENVLKNNKNGVFMANIFIISILLSLLVLLFDNIAFLFSIESTPNYFIFPSLSFYLALFVNSNAIIKEDV